MSSGLRCERLFIAQIWFLLSICIKELHVLGGTANPGIPHPFLLLPAQPFLPPASDHVLSWPLPTSSILLTRVPERWLARDTPTLLPLTHRILQAWSFPLWNYFADVSSSPVDTCTIQAKKAHTSTPFPGSRQCCSLTELIPGCRRGSPAEAAGAAQCSGEDRQGN